MDIWAIVDKETGLVENVIMLENTLNWPSPDGKLIKPIENAGIGDIFDFNTGKYINPVSLEEQIE